jgi:hypothetical protein
MNDNLNSAKPAWLTRGMIGGVVSIAAGFLGFLDYMVPMASQDICIDVEEGISDLYIAGLALVGGILAISSRTREE